MDTSTLRSICQLRSSSEALGGLAGCHCIADDIVIEGVGETIDDATHSHDKCLLKLLQTCANKGIVLNESKFELCVPIMGFMGQVLGSDNIRYDPAKVKAILDMPNPTDVPGVRRLMGMVNFLAKCIPHLTTMVRPIQALVARDAAWHWGHEHEQTMKHLKTALSAAPVLVHYDTRKYLVLQCDASKDSLGAALMQDGGPIAYASRALSSAECNYAHIEKELLSVVFGMQKFHQYTYGQEVTVENDHKPLVAITMKPIANAPARLQAMLLCLQVYDYKIVIVAGKYMHLVDALSQAFIHDSTTENPVMDTIHCGRRWSHTRGAEGIRRVYITRCPAGITSENSNTRMARGQTAVCTWGQSILGHWCCYLLCLHVTWCQCNMGQYATPYLRYFYGNTTGCHQVWPMLHVAFWERKLVLTDVCPVICLVFYNFGETCITVVPLLCDPSLEQPPLEERPPLLFKPGSGAQELAMHEGTTLYHFTSLRRHH